MRIQWKSYLIFSGFLSFIALINADTQFDPDAEIHPYTVTQQIDLDLDDHPDRIITFYYDKQGGNLSQVIIDENADSIPDTFRHFTYDEANRLISLSESDRLKHLTRILHYTYSDSTQIEHQDNNGDGTVDIILRTLFDIHGNRLSTETDINADNHIDIKLYYNQEYDQHGYHVLEGLDINQDGAYNEVTRFSYNNYGDIHTKNIDLNADGAYEELQSFSYNDKGLLDLWRSEKSGDNSNIKIISYEYLPDNRISNEQQDNNGDGIIDSVTRYLYSDQGILPAQETSNTSHETPLDGDEADKFAIPEPSEKITFKLRELASPGLTNINNPVYKFHSPVSGHIRYLGSCSSKTRFIKAGINHIRFHRLKEGTYTNCSILVMDNMGNLSEILHVSPFTIQIPRIVIEQIDDHYGSNDPTYNRTSIIHRNEYGDTIYEASLRDGRIHHPETSHYLYDTNGEILTKATDEDGDGIPNYIELYTYDENRYRLTFLFSRTQKGNFISLSTYTYTFDNEGRLQTEEVQQKNDKDYPCIISFKYDAESNLIADYRFWPKSGETYTHTYTFDDNGNEKTWGMDWNADGLIDATRYNTYDNMGNLLFVFDDNPAKSKPSRLSEFSYKF